MKRRMRRVSSFRLVAGLALTLAIAGCAGVSSGPAPVVLFLLTSFILTLVGAGTPLRAEPRIECDGTVQTACENGVLVDACCPRGAICNFGRGLEICDDGSCVVYPDRCTQEEATPTPTPITLACPGDCDRSGSITVGELVRGVSILLSGSGLAACSAIDADSDGAVVISEAVRAVANALHGCPPECGGTWGQSCRDGIVTDVCCPAGYICNFGRGMTICEDGSCVNSPDSCADTCDGRWETGCQDGALVRACCPAGLACNFGLGLEICDDGSCVYGPDSCR